jgi:hypothetical protein
VKMRCHTRSSGNSIVVSMPFRARTDATSMPINPDPSNTACFAPSYAARRRYESSSERT